MNRSIAMIMLCASSLLQSLPLEMITEKGDYLKTLITQVNVTQFKNDAAIFFEFDREFPPSIEALRVYKQVADELVAHAKTTRGEKFEERKLLLGTTIHDYKALAQFLVCAIITTVGVGGTGFMALMAVNADYRHQKLNAGFIAALGALATAGFGHLTKRCKSRAISKADIIAQQMKDLNQILDQCKIIQETLACDPLLMSPLAIPAETPKTTLTTVSQHNGVTPVVQTTSI